MVDVFFVCFEDWLKHILYLNGKISKILQKIYPSTQNIIKCSGEFANVIMLKVKKKKEEVFKHYKKLYGKCIPATFDNFASECVHTGGKG